ncbi:cytochrome P450 [Coniophora puteana RWD-64-598 SS2]|uniref:Cytochrome P450 n=1 Tax=Coniophora puteana (strain RWD-64-598) TaxID=741705 RepID=A0A5M3MWR5_CONPW|nr:cytochrome P450 [Coniophora puteana RWD-64-598 SS2]EIW83510.1 cytochrome P450 [Coniophora puteana RWD-64-598 SS2]
MFGQDAMIIGSESVAKSLLDKRSTTFSGRLSLNAHSETGLDCNTGFIGCNDTWRLHRRMHHDAFRREAVPRYHSSQMRRVHILMDNLLERPELFEEHLQTFSASIILSVVYGYEATSSTNPLISLVERVDKLVIENIVSFEVVVAAIFPFLLKAPTWIPDFGVKKKISCIRARVYEAAEAPFKYAQDALMQGTVGISMVSDVLKNWEDKIKSTNVEDALKGAAFTAYTADAETTTSVLLTFMYLMAVHPNVQKRMQDQLEATIGTTRMPALEDRQSLPLVDAVLGETIRWSPVVPFNIPHRVTADEVYEGFFIPKGSPHYREIFYDPTKYVNPEHFDPDRFLHSDGTLNDDTSCNMIFGFGRRVCPGRYLADNSIWLVMTSILSMFNISKAEGEYGEDIEVAPQWVSGVTT